MIFEFQWDYVVRDANKKRLKDYFNMQRKKFPKHKAIKMKSPDRFAYEFELYGGATQRILFIVDPKAEQILEIESLIETVLGPLTVFGPRIKEW